jgi:hypothetical protein
MRPAGESEFRQDVSQDLQESGLFFVHRDKPVQTTSVPAEGFNDIQAFEFLGMVHERPKYLDNSLSPPLDLAIPRASGGHADLRREPGRYLLSAILLR